MTEQTPPLPHEHTKTRPLTGIGFRPRFRQDIFLHRAEVEVLELTLDHYLLTTWEKQEELALLQANFTLIPHGLHLSLGSAEGLDLDYLKRVAKLIRKLDPPFWSEHIAFTHADGREIGHLMPLPFSREAIRVVCRNLETVRRFIPHPLLLENIAALFRMPGGELSEAQFLSELVEKSGCDLLLDVMNLHANALNHGEDAQTMLNHLPLEKVRQLHFVGGHLSGGKLIDSHAHPTPEAVWLLMEKVMQHAPIEALILERDENFPPFAELAAELRRAQVMWKNLHGQNAAPAQAFPQVHTHAQVHAQPHTHTHTHAHAHEENTPS
ncbi:MAG: DUF692 domain-containing protein [Myxococcota bacterium]